MDAKTTDAVTTAILKQIRRRLEKALTIAKAAETCADSGNIETGIEIALDIEQPIYEANTLLNAINLLRKPDGE